MNGITRTFFSYHHVILHVSPAEGAVVSAWFSPRLAAHCWAAGPRCSSAGDSHKAHSKERSADDRIKLDLECLNKYNEVCRQVNIFYFIPVVWETEGIHKMGTGNVETSKGYLKQLSMHYLYKREEPCCSCCCISMLFYCTWTGFRVCWGTFGLLGSCGGPSCSCWPLETSIGVSWLPWFGRNSWGPWGLKGLTSWGFKPTSCGVSSMSGCCCNTYWGNIEDPWRRRDFFSVSF